VASFFEEISQSRGSVGIEFPWTADIPRLENRETWGTRPAFNVYYLSD
jgi:hypothetical protein